MSNCNNESSSLKFCTSSNCPSLGHLISVSSTLKLISILFCFLAVSQSYSTESHNEYVVVNNDALMKCNIPSYVADFVTIAGWVDSEGNSYRPSENMGKEE